jgi:tetratricopeptide (TPR) repeat protein
MKRTTIVNFGLSVVAIVLFLFVLEFFLGLEEERPGFSPQTWIEAQPVTCIDSDLKSKIPIANSFFSEGINALARDEYEFALNQFRQATEADPDFSNALAEQAKIALLLGNYQEARTVSLQMIAVDQNDFRAQLILGDLNLFTAPPILNGFAEFESDEEILKEYQQYEKKGLEFKHRGNDYCFGTILLYPLCAFRNNEKSDFSLKPSFSTVHLMINYSYLIHTNSLGFRDTREIQLEKNPLIQRVFFLGDSYVFGYAVPQDKTIPHQLEQQLISNAQTEVLNLGVPGYDLLNTLQWYDAQSYLNPDVVLIGINGTDLTVGKSANAADAMGNKDCIDATHAGCLYTLKSCSLKISNSGYNFLDNSRVSKFFQERIGISDAQKPGVNEWENTQKVLQKLVENIRENNARPVIVFIPFDEVIYNTSASDEKRRLVEKFAMAENVLMIDPSTALIQKNEETPVYHSGFDSHTNEYGNAVIAKEIAEQWERINPT